MPIEQSELEVRLTDALHSVAATTVATPRAPTAVAPAPKSRNGHRSVAGVAAAAVVLAAVALVAGTRLGTQDRVDTGADGTSPTIGADTAPAARSGIDAYVVPPRELAGRPLTEIASGWDVAYEEPATPPDWRRLEVQIGEWSVSWDQQEPARSIQYRYSTHEDAAVGPPGAWIGLVAPTRIDLYDIRHSSGVAPATLEGPDGLVVADLAACGGRFLGRRGFERRGLRRGRGLPKVEAEREGADDADEEELTLRVIHEGSRRGRARGGRALAAGTLCQLRRARATRRRREDRDYARGGACLSGP